MRADAAVGPIVISDGSVIVADQFNRRWVLFGAHGFAISSVDTGEWSILAQPVADAEHVYAVAVSSNDPVATPSPARCSCTAWPT